MEARFAPAAHADRGYRADADAPGITDAIVRSARTGNNGDGIVGVTELVDVVRIRTGERADAAL